MLLLALLTKLEDDDDGARAAVVVAEVVIADKDLATSSTNDNILRASRCGTCKSLGLRSKLKNTIFRRSSLLKINGRNISASWNNNMG